MHMTFFWTANVGDFFFDGVEINSVTSLMVGALVVGLLSLLYEGIKVSKIMKTSKIIHFVC